MDAHPLNKAHQQHRRAEAHLRYKRFDEAMQCHQNAAELLLDAMKSTTSPYALESISLQHSYHLKQKDLIRYKQEQYERVRKVMDNLKYLSRDPDLNLIEHQDSNVQIAIYKAMQETDSLLDILLQPSDGSDDTLLTKTDIKITDVVDGFKSPIKKAKDQQTIIEELQTLSSNLHTLVDKLVMQVEVIKDENTTLKERVSFLEKERKKYLNILPESSQQNNFQVVTSSGNDLQSFLQPTEVKSLRRQSILEPVKRTVVGTPNFDLSAFKNYD